MSVGDFRTVVAGGPGDTTPGQCYRGRIARTPASDADSLIVVLPDFSMAFPRTVPSAQWEHASNLPVLNASCLVVLDENDDAWVPLWEGMIAGAAGDTNTVWSGEGAPSGTLGSSGDFYIDDAAWLVYGPKNGSWPAGTNMVGPEGVQGPPGVAGPKGDGGATARRGQQVRPGRRALRARRGPPARRG